jgi:mannose-1-phosphate guanylyltransferase
MPDLSAGLVSISQALGTDEEQNRIHYVWKDLRPETIDYGIMEGARQVAMVHGAGMGWSDVGSWDSLYDILPADSQGNITLQGELIDLDARNVLLVQAGEPRPVVAIGLENVVVVDTGDVLLICDRSQAQKVRAAVEIMEKSDRAHLT